jgi:hypothetical protein
MPGAREIRGPQAGTIMTPPKSRARLRREPPRRPPEWVCLDVILGPQDYGQPRRPFCGPTGVALEASPEGLHKLRGGVGGALQVRRGAFVGGFVDGFGLYVCLTIPCPLGLRPQFLSRPCFDSTHRRHLYDLRGPPPIAVFGAPLARAAAVGGVAGILYPPPVAFLSR